MLPYTTSYVRQIHGWDTFCVQPGPTSDMMIVAPPNSGEACCIYNQNQRPIENQGKKEEIKRSNLQKTRKAVKSKPKM